MTVVHSQAPGTGTALRPASDPIPYVDLLSLVGETNRCPGGKRTIRRIASRLGIGPGTRVLEIGSNTGFTSLELAKITGCTAVGIDVSPAAVAEAERKRVSLPSWIADRVSFSVGDACDIKHDDASFDVIVCGGANTFVQDREAALREYLRVLRPYGFVSVTNLYYRKAPDQQLLDDLREVLGFEIPPYGLRDWLKVLAPAEWEIYDLQTTDLVDRPASVVEAYSAALCSAERLPDLDEVTRLQVKEQWQHVTSVFNRNHAHLGFMELTLRRNMPGDEEQPELFLMPGTWDHYFEQGFVAGPRQTPPTHAGP
ncbi:class I SAM-dependent methyltransferase [Kitasatospora aureofaciens]|uniref:class I SAM-dependent methyltransferase n=1 Tax=Kitasatospora aureofaciens TaxID=1894 RepID=UPI00340A83F0